MYYCEKDVIMSESLWMMIWLTVVFSRVSFERCLASVIYSGRGLRVGIEGELGRPIFTDADCSSNE